MQKTAFGAQVEWLKRAVEACKLFAKSADVQVAGAPAAGSGLNQAAGRGIGAQPTSATSGVAQGGYSVPGQAQPSNFAILSGQKPGLNLGLGGFGVVGGMVGGAASVAAHLAC